MAENIKVLNEFIPKAEQARFGGVKIGDTLSIDASGVLNTNAETTGIGGNRLTSIPRNIRVSISNNTLTVNSGGKVYIPAGFESDETTRKFEEYTLTKSYTRNDTTLTPSIRYMISFSKSEDTIKLRPLDNAFSGAIQPTGQSFYFWYDTANNLMKAYTNSALDSDTCCLPIGMLYTDAEGKIDRASTIFDRGWGYICNEFFLLPHVHGVYPNGLDSNTMPIAIQFETTRVLTLTISEPYQVKRVYTDGNSLVAYNYSYYSSTNNLNYVYDVNTNSNTAVRMAYTGTLLRTTSTGKISSFSGGRTYATNYERVTDDRCDYYGMTANWLPANNGQAINNSLNSKGALIAFDRYKSQNGVFLARGYQTNFGITYTADSIIAANSNNITHNLVLLDESGNSSFPGNIAATGSIQATATSAYWADLAEKYLTDKKYPIGTLVAFGGEKEMTLATKHVNGVISEKPGYTLNSKSKGQPIALIGKTKVRVVGIIDKGDKLVLYKNGVARTKKWYDIFKKTIGIALEANIKSEEKLVMSVVKLVI